jgi:phosphoglycolate phosphatase
MTTPSGWPRAVVFDLDGTLIDSAPDIAAALNLTFEKQGLPAFRLDEVKTMIGGGVSKLIERALLAKGRSPEGLAHTLNNFLDSYRDGLTSRTCLYEGAGELLSLLRREGKSLGICTNKPHALTLEILRQLGLASFFSAVAGEMEGLPHKPDPAPLRAVLAQLNAMPKDAIMVGDSAADVECARATGVPVVVVDFGYSRASPYSLGAHAVISRLNHLPSTFAELYAAVFERDSRRQ